MSEEKKNFELFQGKTLSDVFKDIYGNSTSTKDKIVGLVEQLKPYIKGIDSAVIIVPLIKEYLEISVRNDEQLVKLADIVQRLLKESGVGGSENSILTEEDKDQILSAVTSYEDTIKKEVERKEKVDEKLGELGLNILEKKEEENGI